MISTAAPQPRSVRAAASPAMPAPTIRTRTPSPRTCPHGLWSWTVMNTSSAMWRTDGRRCHGARRGYAAVPQVAEQDVECRGGSEHPPGRGPECDDSHELLSHCGVALGRDQHPVDIGVD